MKNPAPILLSIQLTMAVLSITSITGCGGPDDSIDSLDSMDSMDSSDEGGDLAETDDQLYEASSKIWSNHTIHVCWITSGWSTEKQWVKEAALGSWARVANLTFDDWGRCPSPSLQPYWPYSGIRIRINEDGPNCSALGKSLSSLGQMMTLNFNFANWSHDYCSGVNRESCIRAIAAHEFGHGLGFAHEHNRPDTDRSICTDAPQGSNGDVLLGGWDLYSIMNYCNPDWNNEHVPGYLSSGDVSGVRTVYGVRADGMSQSTAVSLATAETTIYGSTLNATNDGPPSGVGCSSGANVWYAFTLSQPEVLWIDTAGSGWDTSMYLVDSNGAVVPNFGNDDSTCTGGDWLDTRGYESRISGLLQAGTYRLSVGGCASENFVLHVQHLPQGLGSYYEGQLTGSGVASTYLTGDSRLSSVCGGAPSGEDVRWYTSCGAQSAFFSMCMSDGGDYVRSNGSVSFDPVLYSWTGQSAAIGDCNDDGGSGFSCQGTGGDTANYGSRLSVTTSRGINGVVVDERSSGTPNGHGLDYELFYTVP